MTLSITPAPGFRGLRGNEIMKTHTLNVSARAQTGRSASRRLRKVDRIPAILYGKHTKAEKRAIEGGEFGRLVKAVAGRSVLIELKHPDRLEPALSFHHEVQ